MGGRAGGAQRCRCRRAGWQQVDNWLADPTKIIALYPASPLHTRINTSQALELEPAIAAFEASTLPARCLRRAASGANQLYSPWLAVGLAAIAAVNELQAAACAASAAVAHSKLLPATNNAAAYLANTPGAMAALDAGLAAARLPVPLTASQVLQAVLQMRLDASMDASLPPEIAPYAGMMLRYDASRLVELEPSRPAYHQNLAALSAREGQWRQSAAQLRTALQLATAQKGVCVWEGGPWLVEGQVWGRRGHSARRMARGTCKLQGSPVGTTAAWAAVAPKPPAVACHATALTRSLPEHL